MRSFRFSLAAKCIMLWACLNGPLPPTRGMVTPTKSHVSCTEYILPFTATPHGQIVVDAKIDGRPVGAFLVDTGTSVNLITDTLVAKLALKPLPFPREQAPLWDGKPATLVSPILQVGSLTLSGGAYIVIGGATARNLTVILGQPVAGVIKMQTLRYLATEIDFSAHQIAVVTLREPVRRRRAPARLQRRVRIPTTADPRWQDLGRFGQGGDGSEHLLGIWTIMCRCRSATVGGWSRRVLQLDTGSTGTVFGHEVGTSLKLNTQAVLTVRGLGRTTEH